MQFISAADSMAQLVIQHDAVVGFMSQANYENSAPKPAHSCAWCAQPGNGWRIYLLHPCLASRQAQLMRLIQQFGQSAEGMQYFQENKLDGYRLLKPGELEVMRPYADEARRTLATARTLGTWHAFGKNSSWTSAAGRLAGGGGHAGAADWQQCPPAVRQPCQIRPSVMPNKCRPS